MFFFNFSQFQQNATDFKITADKIALCTHTADEQLEREKRGRVAFQEREVPEIDIIFMSKKFFF